MGNSGHVPTSELMEAKIRDTMGTKSDCLFKGVI
jgi:hypothetical protein